MKRYLAALTVLAFLFPGPPADAADHDWPQWRGPERTGISPDTGLLKEWPEGGPKLVWTFENAGLGYSSFAVVDGRLYTMGSRDNTEQLLCLDAGNGQELWAADISPQLENSWGGGPRSTPSVAGDYVYGLSGRGILFCVERQSGAKKWTVDVTDLGGEIPNWGYSESVLVDGNKVLCTPGGDRGTVFAFDTVTGDVLWKTVVESSVKLKKQPKYEQGPAKVQYSSIVPTTINGDDQYVQLTQNMVFGLDADDGKLLWKSPWPKGDVAVIPTPVIKGNHVFITSAYGAGCKLVEINPDYSVEDVYYEKDFQNHHGGVVLVDDTIYGHTNAGWVGLDFMTGEFVARERSLGKGSVTYADGMLYCVEEKIGGDIVLLKPGRDGFTERGRFSLPQQSEIRSGRGRIWTHPVVINGKLFLRDQDLIFCYDVSGS